MSNEDIQNHTHSETLQFFWGKNSAVYKLLFEEEQRKKYILSCFINYVGSDKTIIHLLKFTLQKMVRVSQYKT
jgi:hypothetical protein